jgi:deoxyribonuclease V
MIAAIDAHYRENFAKFVLVTFGDWTDEAPKAVYTEILTETGDYVPGEFYKRELPGILEVLKNVKLDEVNCIVIDGYVYLDENKKPGLGWHLFEKLGRKIPVVGVAKSQFFNNEKLTAGVLRGHSKKPLFVTSAGMETGEAAARIEAMHGAFRMPDVLRELDRLTKL